MLNAQCILMTLSSDRPKLVNFYTSPIGKKVITGITGLGLSFFVLFHLGGNLTLLASSKAYNQLAHAIDSWGHEDSLSIEHLTFIHLTFNI